MQLTEGENFSVARGAFRVHLWIYSAEWLEIFGCGDGRGFKALLRSHRPSSRTTRAMPVVVGSKKDALRIDRQFPSDTMSPSYTPWRALLEIMPNVNILSWTTN